MSKATVVSVFPFEINQEKPGVYPTYYHLDKATDGEPQIIIVEDGFSFIFDGVTGRGIRVTQLSDVIARSIAEDFKRSFIETDNDAYPGVFWLEGPHTLGEVQTIFEKELKAAYDAQEAWFRKIVRLGDDDFQRYGQHRAVSDLQRYAADYLKLDRPWVRKIEQQKQVNCPACQSVIPEAALVCFACRVIVKPEEFKAKQLQQING